MQAQFQSHEDVYLFGLNVLSSRKDKTLEMFCKCELTMLLSLPSCRLVAQQEKQPLLTTNSAEISMDYP